MPFDNTNMEDINAERRKAIAETIHTISDEEMKALGEALFPVVDRGPYVGAREKTGK